MTDPGVDPWAGLMAAAQDGDRAAYRCLLLAITPYVRAVASRVLTDPNQIEDAVQDVLIALHEARASYDPARPFRPWLAGIARHRIIDRRRAWLRRAARETALLPEHDALWPVHQPVLAEPDRLSWAVAQLPATQRLAIERLKLGTQSLRAVAAETGLTTGALKTATHRGIARLRLLLTRERTA